MINNYISNADNPRSLMGAGAPVETFEDLAHREDLGIEATATDVLDCYFRYLCDLSGLNGGVAQMSTQYADQTYFYLAWTLHSIRFFGGVPNDENRAADGKNLRKKFSHIHSSFKDYSVLCTPSATVLEVISALAERIDSSLYSLSEDSEESIHEWVMIMLQNLGIDKYNDSVWNIEAYEDVKNKIFVMLNRDYDEDGHGALFPKLSPLFKNKNYRDQEIWYQMQFFLREKFFGNDNIKEI